MAALLRQADGLFSTDDRRYIRAIAGGHPYLLQLTAATMWDAITSGENDIYRRHMSVGQEVYQQTRSHFAQTWRVWSQTTRKAVTTVALSQMPYLLDRHNFLTQNFLREFPDFMPEINDLAYIGVVEQADEIPGGYQLTQGAMLWWLADELVRTVRDDKSFETWLTDQHLQGPVTRKELAYLGKAGEFTLNLLKQGAATLIEAYAKGLVGG